jgi:hypothetical protein
MLGSITWCVLRCPKVNLCDKSGVWKYGNVVLVPEQVIWKKLLVRTKSYLSCSYRSKHWRVDIWTAFCALKRKLKLLTFRILQCLSYKYYIALKQLEWGFYNSCWQTENGTESWNILKTFIINDYVLFYMFNTTIT